MFYCVLVYFTKRIIFLEIKIKYISNLLVEKILIKAKNYNSMLFDITDTIGLDSQYIISMKDNDLIIEDYHKSSFYKTKCSLSSLDTYIVYKTNIFLFKRSTHKYFMLPIRCESIPHTEIESFKSILKKNNIREITSRYINTPDWR